MCQLLRKRAFTLVELLVVIAIIALLLSILMPSLQKVRDQSHKVVCSSNLHQLGISMNMYAQNNRETVPGIDPVFTTEQRVDAVSYRSYFDSANGWHDFGSTWRWLSLIYPKYVNDGKVFYCPGSYVKYKDRWKYYGKDGITAGKDDYGFVWTYWAQPSEFTLTGIQTWRTTRARSDEVFAWDGSIKKWAGVVLSPVGGASGVDKLMSWHTRSKVEGQNQLYFDGAVRWTGVQDPKYIQKYDTPWRNYP